MRAHGLHPVGMRLGIVWLLALGASGCVAKEGRWCTAVGCADTVTFDLGSPHLHYAEELPLALRTCIGESCAHWVLDAKDCKPADEETPLHWCHFDFEQRLEVWMPLQDRSPREIAVSVSIRSKDGDELFAGQKNVLLEPHYPNGYECDKYNPCWQATADFSSAFR